MPGTFHKGGPSFCKETGPWADLEGQYLGHQMCVCAKTPVCAYTCSELSCCFHLPLIKASSLLLQLFTPKTSTKLNESNFSVKIIWFNLIANETDYMISQERS